MTERGPSAQRVAENVKALRKARGLDLADLAARLDDLGHPISVSGLSKVELKQRRVDVDDLLALAVALDVSPNRLLLGATASSDATVRLVPNAEASERTAWWWAAGERPLASEANVFELDREARFRRENQPHDPPDETLASEIFDKEDDLVPVTRAVLAAREATGLRVRAILDYVQTSTTLLDTFRAAGARKEAKENGEHQ